MDTLTGYMQTTLGAATFTFDAGFTLGANGATALGGGSASSDLAATGCVVTAPSSVGVSANPVAQGLSGASTEWFGVGDVRAIGPGTTVGLGSFIVETFGAPFVRIISDVGTATTAGVFGRRFQGKAQRR
jgi:hypothetical protein